MRVVRLPDRSGTSRMLFPRRRVPNCPSEVVYTALRTPAEMSARTQRGHGAASMGVPAEFTLAM